MVRVLLEAGADPMARKDLAGTTPLHYAADAGSVAAIEALLAAGANVDVRELDWDQTPLMYAASRNRVDAIDVLLAAGADAARDVARAHVEAPGGAGPSVQGRRASRRWRSSGELPTIRRRGCRHSTRCRRLSRHRGGSMPLEVDEIPRVDWHQAQLDGQELGYADLVELQGGLTPLLHAVREGHAEAVRALLEGGADVDQISEGDHTRPLLMAMVNGHFDLGLELLERGADPTLASDAGATPLYAALNTRWAPKARFPQQQAYLQQEATYLEVMEALIDHGADVNARLTKHLWYMEYTFSRLGLDTWGATPFFRAAHALDVDAMRLLVAYGADPSVATNRRPGRCNTHRHAGPEVENLPDHSGLPAIPAGGPGVYPIHVVTGFGGTGVARAGNSQRHVPDGWLPAVRYLVEEMGADVNARDYLGYTPLHHAAGRGNNELIRYLVELGADPKVVSRSGQTTVDMANGPVSLGAAPFPETIALLESLGAERHFACVYC